MPQIPTSNASPEITLCPRIHERAHRERLLKNGGVSHPKTKYGTNKESKRTPYPTQKIWDADMFRGISKLQPLSSLLLYYGIISVKGILRSSLKSASPPLWHLRLSIYAMIGRSFDLKRICLVFPSVAKHQGFLGDFVWFVALMLLLILDLLMLSCKSCMLFLDMMRSRKETLWTLICILSGHDDPVTIFDLECSFRLLVFLTLR